MLLAELCGRAHLVGLVGGSRTGSESSTSDLIEVVENVVEIRDGCALIGWVNSLVFVSSLSSGTMLMLFLCSIGLAILDWERVRLCPFTGDLGCATPLFTS